MRDSAMRMNKVTVEHNAVPACVVSSPPNIERLRQRVSRKHDRFSSSCLDSRSLADYARTITAAKSNMPSTLRSRQRITILCVCVLLMVYGLGYQFLQFMKASSVSTGDLQPVLQFLLLSLVFFTSGLLKGISGIGMGLLAVPMITLLYSPVLAVALVALPLVATNLHQGVIAGDFRKSLQTHMPLAIAMSVTMAATARYAYLVSPGVVEWAIGLTAIVFVLVSLMKLGPLISNQYDMHAQVVTGTVAGFVGGITGLVVIPLVLYMMLRNIDKERFVSLTGLLLLLSGLALLFGHILNGVMTKEVLILSAIASAPAVIGTLLGERLRHRVSERKFRRLVLILLFAIGLKTLLEGVLGSFSQLLDLRLYGLFLITGVSLAYWPGPSVVYTVIGTLSYGRTAMRSRVLGQIASDIIYGVISIFGVGTIIRLYPNLLPIFAVSGAIYLAYVSISQISFSGSKVVLSVPRANARDRKSSLDFFTGFKESLYVGLSNPKMLLIYLVLLPQFTSLGFSIPLQMAILVCSQWILKGSALVFYVQGTHRLGGRVHHPNTRQKIINGMSVFLLMIALYILLTNLMFVVA